MNLSRRRKSKIRVWEVLVIALSLTIIAAVILLIIQDRRDRGHLEVLEQRLRKIRRLGTVRQIYRSVIYFEEKNFWRGGKMVLFTVEHGITAGIDLSEGFTLGKRIDGSVEVKLPPARILSVDADEGSIHQMLLREGLFNNPVRIGDYMPSVIAQGEVTREAALEEGILHLAERSARSAITRILGLGGIDDVNFISRAPLAGTGSPEESPTPIDRTPEAAPRPAGRPAPPPRPNPQTPSQNPTPGAPQ